METIKVFIDYQDTSYSLGCENYACVVSSSTLESAKRKFSEALEFHFEGMRLSNESCPADGAYQFVYEFSIQALLQHYKAFINLSALSRVTGINQALLSHYAVGLRSPREAQRKKIINGFHIIAKELASIS